MRWVRFVETIEMCRIVEGRGKKLMAILKIKGERQDMRIAFMLWRRMLHFVR